MLILSYFIAPGLYLLAPIQLLPSLLLFLKPVVDNGHLLVQVPHAHVEENEGNDSYEEHQVVLAELKEGMGYAEEIADGGYGVDGEED